MIADELAQKTLASGEVVTLNLEHDEFVVDCWDTKGNNRWSLRFHDAEAAQQEFNRWT